MSDTYDYQDLVELLDTIVANGGEYLLSVNDDKVFIGACRRNTPDTPIVSVTLSQARPVEAKQSSWPWPGDIVREMTYIKLGRPGSNRSDDMVLLKREAVREIVERLEAYHEKYGDI